MVPFVQQQNDQIDFLNVIDYYMNLVESIDLQYVLESLDSHATIRGCHYFLSFFIFRTKTKKYEENDRSPSAHHFVEISLQYDPIFTSECIFHQIKCFFHIPFFPLINLHKIFFNPILIFPFPYIYFIHEY